MASMHRAAGGSAGVTAADWTGVPAELDRVLGPEADPGASADMISTARAGASARPRRSRWALAMLLVVAIAGGVAAAMLVPWWPSIAARPASAVGMDVPQPHLSARTSPLPAKAMLAIAAPAPTSDTAISPAPAHAATPPLASAGQSANAPVHARAPVRLAALRTIVPVPSATPLVQGGCAGLDGDDLARCLQPRLLVADHRLVDAYAAAAAAGVARPLLVAVRDRWADARDVSRDDPRGTLRRYAELTDDLRGMTARRRLPPDGYAE